jgi:hypothetical protein
MLHAAPARVLDPASQASQPGLAKRMSARLLAGTAAYIRFSVGRRSSQTGMSEALQSLPEPTEYHHQPEHLEPPLEPVMSKADLS